MHPHLGEGPGLVGGALGLLAQVALPLALFAWGRSVARRRGGRGWLVASTMPLVAGIVSTAGILATVVGLVRAFDSVARADPSAKATLLSQGIATAMWATAVGVGFSVLLYLASVVTFLVGELTRPRARPKTSAPETT